MPDPLRDKADSRDPLEAGSACSGQGQLCFALPWQPGGLSSQWGLGGSQKGAEFPEIVM